MREASKPLTFTNLSVKEVGAAVGFLDISHFVRGFKKRYGVTPSNFRRTTTAAGAVG
jgi:AraC-like DNA-binding protein